MYCLNKHSILDKLTLRCLLNAIKEFSTKRFSYLGFPHRVLKGQRAATMKLADLTTYLKLLFNVQQVKKKKKKGEYVL